jgi:predicted ATP-grasp superfamily ATP-dependent carboligase
MRVLVNDGVRPSMGVVRSLGRRGLEVGVLADTTLAPVLHSRYCTRRYLGPAPTSDAFMAAVMDLLRREAYDAVIPIGYEATLSFAEHREELAAVTRLETMDPDKIRLIANKRNASELARAAGVPAPVTLYPESLAEVRARSRDLQYPVVIKAIRETRGHTVCYARSAEELPDVYRIFCEEWGFSEGSLPMLQEYIPGFGCGFFAIYQHGSCKRIFMHRRIRENPPAGGVSTCAESFYDPKLKEYGIRLLDSLQWHGVAMVEFRRDSRDKEFKLMEVNPRFWGSLDLAVAAGVDFPWYLFQMIQGRELEYSEEYNRHIRFHWPFLDLQHVCRRPTSLGPFVLDVLNPRVKSNVWPRDLAPNLYEGFSLPRSAGQRLASRTRHMFLGPKAATARREFATAPEFRAIK